MRPHSLPCLLAACGALVCFAPQACTLNVSGTLETLEGGVDATVSGGGAKHDSSAGGGGAGKGGAHAEAAPPDPCEDLSGHSYDFERGDQGFTHRPLSSYAQDDPWALGAPPGLYCHSSQNCWVTELYEHYKPCQTAELLSPSLNLSICAQSPRAVVLSFWHYFQFQGFTQGAWRDGGMVQISLDDGQNWDDVDPSPAYQGVIAHTGKECEPPTEIGNHSGWSGTIPSGEWTQVSVAIPQSYRTSQFRFRFVFGANGYEEAVGWLIDDVEVSVQ